MLSLETKTPTGLWVRLGESFFGRMEPSHLIPGIDIKLGDRRFVSMHNVLTVTHWPKEWTGKGLFKVVGYSDKGYKMNKLLNTYVDEEQLTLLKHNIKNIQYEDKFATLGMNFIMSQFGKGGCLSSLHVIKSKQGWELVIHAKIVEVPRKFLADLRLIADLIHFLELPFPIKVTFMTSTLYYSIVGLRAYASVLGTSNMNMHGLPIMEDRNYQASIIKAINEERMRLYKIHGTKEASRGLTKALDYKTGEWKDA